MLSSVCYLITLYFLPLINSVEWREHKGLWYYISDGETVDYKEATQICDSMNAHLAVITNGDQNDFIKTESSNNTERWIGLSTDSSHHNDRQCDKNIWFWNSDWNCTNSFEPARSNINATLPVTIIPTECAGVTAFSGMWAMQDCSQKFGYICQWECKRFYLKLYYDDGKLNGIYNFDSYYNGNARYVKAGTNRRIRIFKSETYEWILIHDDESYTQRARFFTDSYVPYGHKLSWKSMFGAPIDSSSWCVECKELLICISHTNGGMPTCNFMRLNVTIPDYSNLNGTVFIKHIHNSGSCICTPTKDSCGQRCGYIFPYPERITRITLNNGGIVVFTNMCILQEQPFSTTDSDYFERSTIGQSESTTYSDELIPNNNPEKEMSTSDINAQNVEPTQNDGRKSDKSIQIAASVVSGVIVIIIMVVVVTFVLIRRRRNRNKDSALDLKTKVCDTSSSNVYMGFDSHETDNASSSVYTELQTNASPSNAYMGFDSGVTDTASSSVYTELQTNAGSL